MSKNSKREVKMEDRFNKEEAENCQEALNEIMKSMGKKAVNFIGHFNDLFLFLSAAKLAAPEKE